jgi:hypothetical protein
MFARSRSSFAVLSAILASSVPFGAAALAAQGCGDGVTVEGDSGVPEGDAGAVTLHPDAAPLPGETECTVVETTGIPVPGATHLPVCTPITYKTNPPSGGDHWPAWAAYAAYTSPVPREMYTHNMEHGGVVITYRCTTACAEIKTALEGVFKTVGEAFCPSAARIILTPDPDIPTSIAASAWGATYTATCIDTASLSAFVAKRLGHGTEMICGGGEDPAITVLVCKDGGGT